MVQLLKRLPIVLSLAAMAAAAVLAATSISHTVRPLDTCNAVGHPCNIDGFCNFNGLDYNVPNCHCDLNNICASND
jgi:hypothetical protein